MLVIFPLPHPNPISIYANTEKLGLTNWPYWRLIVLANNNNYNYYLDEAIYAF